MILKDKFEYLSFDYVEVTTSPNGRVLLFLK